MNLCETCSGKCKWANRPVKIVKCFSYKQKGDKNKPRGNTRFFQEVS